MADSYDQWFSLQPPANGNDAVFRSMGKGDAYLGDLDAWLKQRGVAPQRQHDLLRRLAEMMGSPEYRQQYPLASGGTYTENGITSWSEPDFKPAVLRIMLEAARKRAGGAR